VGERAAGWDYSIERVPAQGWSWISVSQPLASLPRQGWKLHVSSAVVSAEAVIHSALPILVTEGVTFKIAGSLPMLAELNSGALGMSQIGKFITVYPQDDDQAVRLAGRLADATRGLRGPQIPSDRALDAGSLVHYRYGEFAGIQVQLESGLPARLIEAPDGMLFPDRRLNRYSPPAWADDPFLAAGVAAPAPAPTPVLANRFLQASIIHESPRGSVRLGVDLDGPSMCVLKRAERDAYLDEMGRDARDRLRDEAAILERLGDVSRFPRAFGLVEDGDALVLAMEDLGGQTLETVVRDRARMDWPIPTEVIVDWASSLAALVNTVHEAGLVYRDLKPPNVLVTDAGIALVDFELAHERTASEVPHGRGTPGYMSPQQYAGERPTIADDVYGFGAVLYFIASGVELSRLPPEVATRRPIQLLNPDVPDRLAQLIHGCVLPSPADRPSSLVEVVHALRSLTTAPHSHRHRRRSSTTPATTERFRALAVRLGDSLSTSVETDADGAVWRTSHPLGAAMSSRDINIGSAGSLLALAELVQAFDVRSHRRILESAAARLASQPPGPRFLPGLYVGEAGVGGALLRAGQVLGDEALVAEAATRGRLIASAPHRSPDLFTGSAGRLRFHLWLWDETGDEEHLVHARDAGEAVMEAATGIGVGEWAWSVPDFDDEAGSTTYLGYAHGAAGIADALLDLFEAQGDERCLELASGAAKWLKRQAVPVLTDRSGLGWPHGEGSAVAFPSWCHGAAGIGQFLVNLSRHGLMDEAGELADGAGRAVIRGSRFLGPLQCHGLAGNLEFLLDLYQATGRDEHLVGALELGELLAEQGVERNGALVWPSESGVTFTPDYMVGYAGVAPALLRLADPSGRPRQLSRQGFRYGTSREVASPVT
jgi:serine/threonine protein kinase